MNKKILTALILSLVSLLGCGTTLSVTGGDYAGPDAAEIVVIRQVGGSQCQVYVKVDGKVVCMLPEWGNYTRFTLEPGQHKFVASCQQRRAKSESKSFNIEANITYYFHVHQRMAEFHKPTMRISELTVIEGNDLISLKDKYEYVQPDGSKQR